MTARYDADELGPLLMPVCVCGCPADEHDATWACTFCDCPALSEQSWADGEPQDPPSPLALAVCLVALIAGLALLTWHDDRCHDRASTAAGHALCEGMAS